MGKHEPVSQPHAQTGDPEPYTGPLQPTIELANALMDAYYAEHARNLELEAKVAELERARAAKPVVGSMEAKRRELNHNLHVANGSLPDSRTFRSISELLEEAESSGPVPTYNAVHQWHGELQEIGLAKTYPGVRDGCVMCPRAFYTRLEKFRTRLRKKLAKRSGQPT
jgi:hypothetical protein